MRLMTDAGVVAAYGSRILSMKNTFPADFYVVSATVIPVLFLALLVQGPGLEQMIEATKKSFDNLERVSPSIVLFILGAGGLVYGIVGEVIALNELQGQHDSMFARVLVFLAVFILLIGVATIPLFTIFGPSFRDAVRRMRKARNRNDNHKTPERES